MAHISRKGNATDFNWMSDQDNLQVILEMEKATNTKD